MQKQYVEKPVKVLGEQYVAASDPPAVGVCRCTLTPQAPEGQPHVHTAHGPTRLQETDWIVTNRFSLVVEDVLTNAEFEERFGTQGGPNA